MSWWRPAVPAPIRLAVRVVAYTLIAVGLALFGHSLIGLTYQRGRVDAMLDHNAAQECRRRGGTADLVYPRLPELRFRPEVRCSAKGTIKPNARDILGLGA